jgi:alpha-methylacyl-CoA racemase
MLENLTLLDFSSMGPGPRCTRLLADYGVRVVKIRPPADATRMMDAPWFTYSANRGIPQIHVDLKHQAGQQLVLSLLPRVDALVESFRPGVAARLGLGYDDARAVNESLVYCSVSGYGQGGPYARWPAHDLNWLAVGGFLDGGSRREGGAPALPGAVVADTVGGYSTAVAVLTALLRRAATGQGAYLDVSVMDGVLRMMQFILDGHLVGEDAASMLTGGAAYYDVYQASDGQWLAVAAIEPQFFAALCRGTGLAHRIGCQHDPALQDVLRQELAAAFATRPRDEWVRLLGPVACVSAVNSPAETLADPHLRSRPLTLDVRVGDRTVRQLTPRLAVPDPPGLNTQPAGPTPPGEVDETLRGLGVAAPQIAELRSIGVIT